VPPLFSIAAMSHNRKVFHATAIKSAGKYYVLKIKCNALNLWFSKLQRRHAKYIYKEFFILVLNWHNADVSF